MIMKEEFSSVDFSNSFTNVESLSELSEAATGGVL